jgi:hypothetical protein
VLQIQNPCGLAEYKNPRNFTISEAVENLPNFCPEKYDTKFRLKHRHDHFYQVQCQMSKGTGVILL